MTCIYTGYNDQPYHHEWQFIQGPAERRGELERRHYLEVKTVQMGDDFTEDFNIDERNPSQMPIASSKIKGLADGHADAYETNWTGTWMEQYDS